MEVAEDRSPSDDVAAVPDAASGVESFEFFYRSHYRPVLRLAFALTGDFHAAENLTQDAFLAAHQAWSRVSLYDQPEQWVRRVVMNRAISRWRRLVTEARALDRLWHRRALPTELPEPHAEVWAAVRRLPPQQARVITLITLEDRSVGDVAGTLGCSEETVRTRGRARQGPGHRRASRASGAVVARQDCLTHGLDRRELQVDGRDEQSLTRSERGRDHE
ncbi:MAG: sigma-70 family RNA polymerase sigma factor, partial [Acidimicrobiia bacterium]